MLVIESQLIHRMTFKQQQPSCRWVPDQCVKHQLSLSLCSLKWFVSVPDVWQLTYRAMKVYFQRDSALSNSITLIVVIVQ